MHAGKPLHHAIVWMDRRTAGLCKRMADELGSCVSVRPVTHARLLAGREESPTRHVAQDALRAVTGLPISTYFSAFKWAWLLENVPEVAAAKAEGRCMLGTVDAWLIYKLTGAADGAPTRICCGARPPHQPLDASGLACRMQAARL